MIEQIFKLTQGNEKTVEKVIIDENIHYLNEEETHEYQAGTVLKVPFHTKMNLKNVSEETLEFIVVKAPAPNC